MTSTTTAAPQRADAPQIAVLPRPGDDGDAPPDYFIESVHDGGGLTGAVSDETGGLVIAGRVDVDDLSRLLTGRPGIGWIQLPSAGIERYADVIAAHRDRTWTSAKGAYAPPVAEHILALTLASLRRLPQLAATKTWGPEVGSPLYGSKVVIVGAGGIGVEAVRLFRAFNTDITVVRRRQEPVASADRTVTTAELDTVLPDADVVVIAAALTEGTEGLMGAEQLALLKPSSVLVNIARGKLVDTEALLAALRGERLAGAALDVTEPEPLPDGHPLWDEPRCLITPHTADTEAMVRPLISARIRENVRRWAAGEELEGLVDVEAGY
ncbi:D-isomer specific 2-hydroxyacid dehydrogenase family protein [Arthrobacter castelli]|uniref:D-isomer specific 2-hydroxyacid dehydrogenase family protein n=1 Tax=Arthrobacter castelli TaxID=271431 RepID=UPI0003F7C7B5|nr:D-isomer specific 2-hydroxyacid dehydrogenase family protein [Arthrobacter castelli]